jgi:glycosyltransferase involved in cell wall biosynthesis
LLAKFILYLGTIEPRKNINSVIEAFENLLDQNKGLSKYKLVLAGGKGWKTRQIFKAVKESNYKSDIIFLDYAWYIESTKTKQKFALPLVNFNLVNFNAEMESFYKDICSGFRRPSSPGPANEFAGVQCNIILPVYRKDFGRGAGSPLLAKGRGRRLAVPWDGRAAQV